MVVSMRRQALFVSTALISAASLGYPPAVLGQTQLTYQFDIPAEDLGKALKDFSIASSQQIVFSAKDVGGPTATALHGHYIAQARLLATRLRSWPTTPAEIVASTLTRAEETAAIMATELPDVPTNRDPNLSECTPPVMASVKLSSRERSDTGRCRSQLDQAFAQYFRPAVRSETDIIVCHGNVIRYFITKALGVDARLWTRFAVGHTSITEVAIRSDGSMLVVEVGDVGHLPSNLQSGVGQNDDDLKTLALTH